MNNQAKNLYEKMIDFKRFAVILLAVGVFFYLGVFIPSDTNNVMNTNIMMTASTMFIVVSLLFFIQSRQYHSKLLELEDGEEFLMKK